MYSRESRNYFNVVSKTASFMLAVLLIISPIGNLAFAGEQTESPWIYDVARVTTSANLGGQFGDYQTSYNFELPASINNLTPNLSLNYSSQQSDHDTYIGYGWNLSIPYVKRLNKTGINKLYQSDYYVSTLSGELTNTSENNYLPRVQTGPFTQYQKNGNSWTAFMSDGTEYSFGSSTDSRMASSSTSTNAFAWYLHSVTDTNGNKVLYEYINEGGKVYPDKILYAFIGNDPAYEIHFTYSSSTEITSLNAGYLVTNDRVLSEVQIYHDGSLLKKFDLEHMNPARSVTPILTSVAVSGYNEAGQVTTSSPKYFDYFDNNVTTWSSDSSYAATAPTYLYQEKVSPSPYKQYYYRDVIIDMNGDTLPDWVDNNVAYLNTGSGFQSTSSWPTLPKSNWHKENRLADINGDLLPDIITYQWDLYHPDFEINDIHTKHIYINQGDGTWVSDTAWAATIPSELYLRSWGYPSGLNEYQKNVHIVDVNGDGLADWVTAGKVYLNTGAGWEVAQSWPTLPSGEASFEKSWRLADVNGDTLPDLIKAERGFYDWNYSQYEGWPPIEYYNIYLNQGDGNWVSDPERAATIPADLYYYQIPWDEGFWGYPATYIVDFNGDGFNDWLRGTTIYMNDGTGWSTTSTMTVPAGAGSISASANNLARGFRLADLDGDGLIDFLQSEIKTYQSNPTTVLKSALINQNQPQLLLSTTTDPYGGVTTIEYEAAAKLLNNELPNPQNPVVINVVTEINEDPIIGDDFTTRFIYEDGEFYFASTTPFDRKFAGFQSVIKSTTLGKNKTYYHQGNDSATSSYEAVDDYAKIGLPYRTEVYDFFDDLYEVVAIDYDLQSLATSSDFVKKTDEVTLRYDGDSDHRDIATAYTYSSSTGLLTSKIEYGEVSASLDGSYSDIGTDKRVVEYEYASNGTNNILGLLSKETLKDNGGTKVSESKYYYDSQTLGFVVAGNLTKQEDWVEDNTYVDRQWTYNSLGQKLSETDPRGKTQLYEYDSFGLFVSSTTNAVGHNTQYEYDYSSGKVATTTDANGEVYVTVFDGLDRPVEIIAPDPQTGNPVTQKTYSYVDTPGSAYVEEMSHLTSSLSTSKYSYLDGFSRVVQERVPTEYDGSFVVKDYIFGNNGLLFKESLPYSSGGSGRTSPMTNTDFLSIYNYDPLSRITSVETAVGTTERSYDQWKETVTDTANNDKTLEYDAFGRLVQVTEEEGANSYDTTYNWNVRGDLIKIIDAEDNVRNLAYDGLGRRISLEDLHDVSDGTFGTWLFEYDDAGNVSSTTDPKGQVVNYSYDDVNRVITEDYLGTGYADITYSYDLCTNGTTKLCSVSNESASTTYTYTPNGLIATEAKTILSTTYTTGYEYDRMGNQTLITYPDSSEVKYTYNKANRLEKVEQRESGGSFTDIVKDYNYGPHGMVTYQTNGNDSVTTKTYDSEELYRLRSIVTDATSAYGTGGPGAELAEIEAELESFEFLNESREETVEQTFSEVSEATATEPQADTISTSTEQVGSVQQNEDDLGVPEELNNAPVEEVNVDVETPVLTEDVVFSLPSSTVPEANLLTANETSTATSAEIETIAQLEKKVEREIIKNQKIEDRVLYVASTKADKKNFEEKVDKFTLKFNDKNEKDAEVIVEALKNKPEFRMKKWNGEVDFGITYEGLLVANEAKSVGNLLRWQNASGTKEVHAYPLPESEQMENGGFEIEVVLTEKPDSNVFVFPVKGYENLDFFHQPELPEEVFSESDGLLCENNECIGQDGSMIIERPENIAGSYAVYHKEKKDHVLGDINYGTGKVLHIYRPKVIDADGKEIWAELTYDKGQLKVTVPNEFLEKASYPVMVDPTFGFTGTGGSVVGYTYSADSYPYKHIGIKRTLQEDAVIQSVSAHIRQYSGHSTRPELRYVILNTSNPLISGTPVYNTVERATVIGEVPSTAWAFNELEVISTSTLPAGDYHLVAGVENGGYLIRFDTTANQTLSLVAYNSYVSENSNMGLFKDSSSSRTYSMYATYGTSTPSVPEMYVESFECMTPGSTDMSCTSMWKQATFTADDGDWQAGTGTTTTPDTGPNGASHDNNYLYVDASSGGNCDGTISEECAIEANIWNEGEGAITFDFHILGDDTGDLYLEAYDGTTWHDMFWSSYAPTWSTASMNWINTSFEKLRFIVRNQSGEAADIAIDNIRISTSTPSGQNFAPGEPINLKVEDQLNPVNVPTPSPAFSARAVDPDLGDLFSAYQIQVSTTSDFTSLVWDSTKVAFNSNQHGWFIPDIVYSGSSLSTSTTYYWKIRFWDDDDAQGLWSTDISTFSIAEPVEPFFRETVQDLNYTYDSVGNVTQIIDASGTHTSATIEYEYDDLYRLTAAGTTGAGTAPYTHSYSYSPIGNILTRSDVGSYSYGETNYANPHAATAIAGVTHAYDANGNLVSTSDGDVYTWNYRNQLIESETASSTTTYAYDHTGSRVLKSTASATTTYPSTLYETTGTSTKKHIYANNTLVATIDSDTPAPETYYVYTNHLGSTNVVLGEDGYINQLLDYYPYGETRIENQYDTHNQTNRYTGHEFDEETELSYMGARYYPGSAGRFISQDPVFLSVGNINQLETKTNISFDSYLKSPQTHNSYSYTANNPILYVDKNGEFLHIAAGAVGGGLIGIGAQGLSDIFSGNYSGYQEYVGAFTGGAIVGGVAAGTGGLSLTGSVFLGAGAGTTNGLVSEGLKVADGTQDTMNISNLTEKVLLGGVAAGIPGLRIQGVTVGRGSFQSVQNQINTKFANGTINSMTPSTAGKIFAAQFADSAPGEAFSTVLQQISRQINAIQTTWNSLQEKGKR